MNDLFLARGTVIRWPTGCVRTGRGFLRPDTSVGTG